MKQCVYRHRRTFALCLLMVLGGCQAGETSATNSPSTGVSAGESAATDPASGLRRPWAHPTVSPKACPVTTTVEQPDPGLAPLLGSGPARAAGLGPGAVLEYLAPAEGGNWLDKTWGGQKVLWAIDPATQGPVLIRGRRIDAPGDLAFEDPPMAELLLNTSTYEGRSGGWKDNPSFTRLRAPGCYVYQVDTRDGTWSIVFIAIGPQL
jgi:hypothetical protein